MEMLAPLGPVYQAGTMSGNPLVMAAGIATVSNLNKNESIYNHLDYIGKILEDGMLKISRKKNIPLVINRVGGMMTAFFTNQPSINNYEDACKCDTDMFKKYFMHMLKNGINLPPSQFEAMFLSNCHCEDDITKFLSAFESLNI